MRAVDLIRKKRDSGEHTREEIDFLIFGYTRGDIPPSSPAELYIGTAPELIPWSKQVSQEPGCAPSSISQESVGPVDCRTVPPSSTSPIIDVTGVFCTSGSEREFHFGGSWYADEEIQAGAGGDAAAAD